MSSTGSMASPPSASLRGLEAVVSFAIFALLGFMGFMVRLFSVIRYESIIHEFDPWFNFRSTKVLVDQGSYAFWNWFDQRSWYPLGRIVGGTVYPGIMYTAYVMHALLHTIGFKVDIREVCVLTAPTFSFLTALAAYLLTTECADSAAGLLAAVTVVIAPGYMSRSVAGSYDNEAVAITALVATFFMWVRSVNTGSTRWSVLATIVYMYMVSTWGGYVFIINLIPIYTILMIFSGRYSHRLYVAYSIFYVLGTLLSMQIRFVGFNAVRTGEHMAAAGTFAFLHLYCAVQWVRSFVPKKSFAAITNMLIAATIVLIGTGVSVGLAKGYFGGWEGRFWSLLDPTFAKRQIPLISSVSEHQPTSWDSIVFAVHFTAVLVPVGLFYVFRNVNDASLFLVVYCMFSVYFVGVMVRLLLVLAPAAVMLASIGFSATIKPLIASIKREFLSSPVPENSVETKIEEILATPEVDKRQTRKRKGPPTVATSPSMPSSILSAGPGTLPVVFALAVIGLLCLPLAHYIRHGVWTASEAYSSPSVVLSTRNPDGSRGYIDDFREAYYWLHENTPDDAKILSWWDYGYQLAGFANRTTIVDNNTWNNTHIGMVGRVLNSPEEKAFRICKKIDVDYVLIVFGGLVGFSGDDINKFLWPVRISRSVDTSVVEHDYLTSRGGYSIGDDAGQAFKDSIMYKMAYYRFHHQSYHDNQGGFDRVRHRHIARDEISLTYFEEAFSSKTWIVRIFRVKKFSNRGFRTLKFP
uniref:dolichyl-diphosphooligosaccharide--protein glycotransferase n=1 Tax=Compsopogon caeruleus TaxID=31354 RepID=A0A7S1XDK1_9RHOD|mmetsp:Transcript_15866/g.31840  ORF Transcript_15866/g.31840 Transcript_15866/m.31840 type:complete len:750 (+) Transcript_15866:144-2393(+)